MLLVRTVLGVSSIHGFGVFAAEPIARGTVVWRFHPELDRAIKVVDLDRLNPHIQEYCRHYGYRGIETDSYILCGDNARFFNHQDEPNIVDSLQSDADSVASRHIDIGEELTCNYWTFDADALSKIGTSSATVATRDILDARPHGVI